MGRRRGLRRRRGRPSTRRTGVRRSGRRSPTAQDHDHRDHDHRDRGPGTRDRARRAPDPAAGTATAGPADLAAGVATGGPADSTRGTLAPASANGDRRATPQQTTAPSMTEQAAAPPATTSTGPITANAPAEAELDRAWLPADESGACPPTHPVKAKRSTRLYHEPGTAAYDRARPDRCYVNAEAAEADGFTRAKR